MHWPESRVFTIANGAMNREFIRLSISAKGKFRSRILDELEICKQVWMKGPYGKFIVKQIPVGGCFNCRRNGSGSLCGVHGRFFGKRS